MGFIKRLLGIGVTVGATVAAVKVADQVKENNPDGIKDVNGDGKVDALDVVATINAVLGIQPLPAADVTGDGAVNALDVVFVINQVLGL